MKKYLLFVLTILLMAGSAHALEHYELMERMDNPKAADDAQNIATADSTIQKIESPPSTSIVTMDGQISDVPVKSVSVETMISDNIQTYSIPISYGFPMSLTGNKELLNLKVVIPWTTREIDNKKDSGLGDITFSANYLIRFPQLLLDSKLIVKAPTGEYEDAEVELGTGSTDAAVYVNGTWYFDRYSLKGGLGYGYNGDTDIQGTDITRGDEFVISGGGDYNVNETLRLGGILVYKNKSEDEIDFLGYTPGINTLELIPSVTYLWKTYNAEFNASLAIPVYDEWNDDKVTMKPAEDPDRSVKFNIGVSKPF